MGAGLLIASASLQTPSAITNSERVEALPDSIPSDSIVKSEGEILTEQAAELYRKVKFMQYDGELENVLYNAALDANKAAMEAIRKSDTEELLRQNRNILSDLNTLLMYGAVYNSNNGNSDRVSDFARAYIDVHGMPEMQGVDLKKDMKILPTLAYNAAYGAVKEGDTEAAKRYFKAYLDSGDEKMKEQVIAYFGQTCIQTKDYEQALEVLSEGTRQYPANRQILNLAMQCCLDGGYLDRLRPLIDKALLYDPSDEKLLNIQARLYEKEGNYKQALEIYRQIADAHPNSLENTRRIATCLYNLGAYYYNESIMTSDEKTASRNRRQSKAFFYDAATALEQLLATTPSDMPFLRALAQTYASLGEREKFDNTNTRIQALGGDPLAFNDMPVMIGDTRKSVEGGSYQAVKVPAYDEFAREYIESRLGSWAKRGEFEKFDDYKKRLAGGEAVDRYKALSEEAADAYLKKYSRSMVLTDLRRSDYDIDNEIYRISTPYGETPVKVPFKNKEAEAFKAGWDAAQIRAPRFIIRDNKVAIAEITYVVNGRNYTFNSKDAANYKAPAVYVDVNGILASAQSGDGASPASGKTAVAGIWTESDVDQNIPVTGRKSENVYALIVANENYLNTSDVFGALHDGSTMRQYCIRTLGIPESQVISLNNATGNQLIDALETLSRRVKGTGPDAEVIFYYAGHGLPDDATKEAYMLPVDGNPRTINTLTPMKKIYQKLGDMDAASVSVFMDACFSGEGRDRAPLVEARGVALKAKEVAPQGNMYVLSAASAQETAMPYKEKHHGLFTYFLLKKLQESKGNATLKEISDYVISNVKATSNSNPNINKEQNPTVTVSGKASTFWERKKLKGGF